MGCGKRLYRWSSRYLRNTRIKLKQNLRTLLVTDNRAEFKISSFIVGLLLVTLVITTLTMGAQQIRLRYGQVDDAEISKYQTQSAEIQSVTNDLQDQVRNDNLGVIGFFTEGTYAAAILSTSAVETFTSFISEFARDQPELAIALGLLVAIVVVWMFFLIVSAAFRWAL